MGDLAGAYLAKSWLTKWSPFTMRTTYFLVWPGKGHCLSTQHFHSDSALFSTLADTLKWLVKWEGVGSVMHYLDDYLLIASTEVGYQEALQNLVKCLRMTVSSYNSQHKKLEGPRISLRFLGIELDTEDVLMSAGRKAGGT